MNTNSERFMSLNRETWLERATNSVKGPLIWRRRECLEMVLDFFQVKIENSFRILKLTK